GDIAPKSGRRVVVIGAGWGGATAARYVRMADPSIEVVLLEPGREFVSCPFSNLVLSGLRTMDSLTRPYDRLRDPGIRIINEAATAIEPDTKRVRIGEGYLAYDRLVVAPGIDFLWEQIEGLPAARDTVCTPGKPGRKRGNRLARSRPMPTAAGSAPPVPPWPTPAPPGPPDPGARAPGLPNTNNP